MKAIVLGSSGFIGGHMVRRLKSEGYSVMGVDIESPKYEQPNYFIQADLRDSILVRRTLTNFRYAGFTEIYQFAADMGGAGYIFTGEHDADIMHNSALINLNVLNVLKEIKYAGKVFYSSSACIYPQQLQRQTNNTGLPESCAYPANPDSEYGWEKIFSERLYLSYARNYGLDIRIARFHNIYGPEGTYEGGREKAPAAICRKVYQATSDMRGHIYIWGDGEQTRSFLYIDDCIDAVRLLMNSDFKEPINIGSEEMVAINTMVSITKDIGQKNHISVYHQEGPQGVRGRNSDNSVIRKELKWEPKYSLKEGLKNTFNWIKSQYK